MARAGTGTVFKSASTGVLRPAGVPRDLDPLQAVLNHSWNRVGSSQDEEHGGRKRTGITTRRALQAEMAGLDKAATSKATDKAKVDEGRSRLGAQGNSLFVDTGASKNRFAPTFEDEIAPTGESPPTSPSDNTAKGSRRAGAKAAAAPCRKYMNEVCPEMVASPRLRSPPASRKGQVKLNFEDEAANADAEHAQAEVDDHRVHLDKEQEHFIDLCHHFHGAINQAGVRLNEMLDKVRDHFLQDAKWLDSKINFDQLAEVSFEVQTTNYFLAKWHHQLEPRKVGAPVRPTKLEDMSADDILAQTLYSLSKMEVLASKLGPVLEKTCHDAKTMRRGANGEPLTPTSKNALLLAKKRGFQDTDEFNKLMGHLEHILSVTQHLAIPPKSGLPDIKKTAGVIMAAAKFKRGLVKSQSPVAATGAGAAIGNAFKSLGESVDSKLAATEEE